MKGPAGMPGFPGMKGHRVSTVSKLTLKLFHLAMFIYLANFIGQLSMCQKWLIPTSCLFVFSFSKSINFVDQINYLFYINQ